MAEYIKREAAIRALMNDSPEQVSYSREDAADCILYMDAADVAPVQHARWEVNELGYLECTHCGWVRYGIPLVEHYPYCPNCGAKMDGGPD